MSRNPYLAATRPTSSFTRSSRTSKRADPSSSLLARSRSSTTLGSLSTAMGATSLYGGSSYLPSVSTSASTSWQRSPSSSRLNRFATDPSNAAPSYRVDDYAPSSDRRAAIQKASSSLSLSIEDEKSPNHLQNYQDSRLKQPQAQLRSRLESRESLDSHRTSSGLSASTNNLTQDGSSGVTSGSLPKHLQRQGHLFKSQSMELGQQQQQAPDISNFLSGAMSLDRMLSRCETMTERELRRSYKDLVLEIEKLRRHLKEQDELEKQKQQDWIRKERQLQRKISELEEENRELEQWRQEFQRLKDENTSLIRVVTKLSKQN